MEVEDARSSACLAICEVGKALHRGQPAPCPAQWLRRQHDEAGQSIDRRTRCAARTRRCWILAPVTCLHFALQAAIRSEADLLALLPPEPRANSRSQRAVAMSALPRRTDVVSAVEYVRKVPKNRRLATRRDSETRINSHFQPPPSASFGL